MLGDHRFARYQAATAELAEAALAAFRLKYPKHLVVAEVWPRNWQRISMS